MTHYQTMSLLDIHNLPVHNLLNDNALLFLWVTFIQLKEKIEIMDSWGFKYKTVAFVWIKTNIKNSKPFIGLGHYTRSNAELCLLGTRGKNLMPEVRNISSVVISPRERHSRKPQEVRDKINLMYPNLKKIELFSREKTPGWDHWGNEVDSDIIL